MSVTRLDVLDLEMAIDTRFDMLPAKLSSNRAVCLETGIFSLRDESKHRTKAKEKNAKDKTLRTHRSGR